MTFVKFKNKLTISERLYYEQDPTYWCWGDRYFSILTKKVKISKKKKKKHECLLLINNNNKKIPIVLTSGYFKHKKKSKTISLIPDVCYLVVGTFYCYY